MGGHLKKWLKIPDIKHCSYLHKNFISKIDKRKVKLIFELGSRDLLDARLLHYYYNARVFAFECNPDSLAICRKNLAGSKNVVLIEKAVWSATKDISFYPVVSSRSDILRENNGKNIGASSCFLSDNTHHEKIVQCEITVPAVRLDHFCADYAISGIDLLCMDIQGAELDALTGLGELLKNVRYIISEIEKVPIYKGQHCFDDVRDYLNGHGFESAATRPYCLPDGQEEAFADYLFINTRISG